MSRYGVYPGNTSASTSTTGETISDTEEDSGEFNEEEEKEGEEARQGSETQPPDGTNQGNQDPTANTDECTARQSTATTPLFEFPFPPGPLDPLSLASALSFHSGEAFTPLERFAFNALIEHYCAQRVSSYLSENLPHHVHEAYKRQLYQRVTSLLGMTGGFDRDEFQGVRESVLDGISAIVNNEMVNIIQEASIQQGPMTPAVEYTPGEPGVDWLAVENPEGNEVVRKVLRRVNRPKSSDNPAPITFVQANPRIATGLERPATSDGRKIGGIPGASRIREGSHLRGGRRPELVRAMSYDHLNQAGDGPKTPTIAPPGLARSTTSYTPGYRVTGYQTPQPRTPTPHGQSHPFRLGSFGPAPPLSTRERNAPVIPSMHHRAPSGRITPHISTIPAIRASVSLQQQTAQAVPMERSKSVDTVMSLFHPQPQHPAERSNDKLERLITSKTSRYRTDFTELAFLGKGGFASVYKVRNILDGREYAIKKVPIRAKHLNDKGDKLDVIFREIKTLAMLEHRNVVRYYSAWVESANGLWERPGKSSSWSAVAPEARGKAESPRIVAQGITENMNLGHGPTPDRAKTKSGPVITEIPVLGGAAFIDDGELNDPLRINFPHTTNDDSMGIQFGDDTTKDSDSTRSPAKVLVTVKESESDSSDTVSIQGVDEQDGDVSSDIEIIPRLDFPSIAIQIPLPLSPQYPLEYLPHRRGSFVSDVDRDGNEIPYVEPFPRRRSCYSSPSGSESGLGEHPSAPLPPDRAREIREALKRLKELRGQGGGRDNAVFDDEDTGDTNESGNTTSVSIRSSSKKPSGTGKENLGNKQIAILQAARVAKREADKKEILTLMIMMSVHPLTLKEFLRYGGSESTQHSAKGQFPLPRGLATQMEQHNHASSGEKGEYCWHLKCALKLFKGVLEGAEYLHNKSIVHRDLKPGNIFLDIEVYNYYMNDKGLNCQYCDKRCRVVPRIGDFGLVAELVDGVRKKKGRGGEDEVGDDDMLRGDVVGTALYRPPPSTDEDEEDPGSSSDEYHFRFASTPPDRPGVAVRGRRRKNIICEKTDVYALGIIFFELLYRCDTGSERVQCILDVRDRRKLPGDWREKVCKEGGADMRGAEVLERCVMGMTESRRAYRWDLGRVKAELRVLEGWE